MSTAEPPDAAQTPTPSAGPSRDGQPVGEPLPAPRRRHWLLHPVLYVVLLGVTAATQWWDILPRPRGVDVEAYDDGSSPMTFRDLFDTSGPKRDTPLGAVALFITVFVLGSASLLGYLILRACNIRVFPRSGPPAVGWDAWHLARVAIVFVLIMRLAAAGVAAAQQLQEQGRFLASVPSVILHLLAANAAMVCVCLFVFALVAAGGEHPLRALGLREKRPVSRAAIGVGGFVMVFPIYILALVATLVYGPFVGIHPQSQPLVQAARHASPGAFAVMMFSGVIVAAVTEEILFRGLLYSTLRRYMGPLGAICLSAAAFALVHEFTFGFLMLFVVGFVVGYLYERTGSLVAPMAAHAAHNLYTFLAILLSQGA